MKRTIYLFISVAFLVRLVCIFALPMNSGSDERAHIHYIETLAKGEFPIYTQKMFAYDGVEVFGSSVYSLSDRQFDEPGWENFQPPLYYVSAVPFYLLGGKYGIRLFGLFIFAVTLVVTISITRKLFGYDPNLQLATIALVSFIPGVIQIQSVASNDGYVTMMSAFALFFMVDRKPVLAGLLTGLAVWSKFHAVALILIGLVYYWKTDRKLLFRFLAYSILLTGLYKVYQTFQIVGGTLVEQSKWGSWGIALKQSDFLYDSFFMGVGYHYKAMVPPFTTLYYIAFVLFIYEALKHDWFPKALGRATLVGTVSLALLTWYCHFWMGMGFGRYLYIVLPVAVPLLSLGVVRVNGSNRFMLLGVSATIFAVVLSSLYCRL